MKALILNGSSENGITGGRVKAALLAELHAAGWEVEAKSPAKGGSGGAARAPQPTNEERPRKGKYV